MSDIELVIRIDEKLYKDIYSDAEIMIYGGMRGGKTLLATLLRAIRNGTPLPKGHGRLGDLSKIYVELNEAQIEGTEGYKGLGEAKQIVCNALTIIEADKEGE